MPMCQIWLVADYTASTASILNLLTLSLDRYWSITSPLKYLGKRTKTRALIMISIAWGISLLWIFPITGWTYCFNNSIRTVPDNQCQTEFNQNFVFKITTAIFNFYIPLIAMIGINTKVYLVIRKRYKNPIMKYTSRASSANPLSIRSLYKERSPTSNSLASPKKSKKVPRASLQPHYETSGHDINDANSGDGGSLKKLKSTKTERENFKFKVRKMKPL